MLVLDIETVANAGALASYDEEGREPPANYKSEDAIERWREKDRAAYAKECALSPRTGQIVCIGTSAVMLHGGAEADLIRGAFDVLTDAKPLVTFNGLGFDLPYLFTRAAILGLTIPVQCSDYLRRYSLWPHVDLFAVLSNYGQARKGDSLHGWARAFGLAVTDDTSGADVAAMWAAGNVDGIAAHCASDVALTEQLYTRLASAGRLS